SKTWSDVAVDADLRHSGSRSDRYSDPLTWSAVDTSLAGFTVLDLAMSYQLQPGLELRARIDNVSDAGYQTVYGFNQQPRSLYVGLTWRPGF
ncbi:protein containing TonB-dependent receptor, beta-barrel domain, partial [sediment metagenome]